MRASASSPGPRVRNWIRHYKELGVNQFIIIDNASDDGTYELLCSIPEVVAIRTNESFKKSNFGIDWLNRIRDRLSRGTWTIYADADEYLIFPGWPDRNISDFAASIDDKANSVFGFMLDMYPRGLLSEAAPDCDLVHLCRYFDKDYFSDTGHKSHGAKGVGPSK